MGSSGSQHKRDQPLILRDSLVGKTVPNADNREEKFYIERMLGKGNFGKVFKAIYQTTKSPVALKVAPTLENIMRGRSDMTRTKALAEQKDIYDRFLKEGDALSDISCPPRGHPNVVKILGTGKMEVMSSPLVVGGRSEPELEVVPFIVMQFIDGWSLPQFMQFLAEQKKTLLWPVAQDIMLQAFAGFDYIHRHKILHRDIKSENIMIQQLKNKAGEIVEDAYHVTIIDFGSVLMLDSRARTMTLTNTTIGTMPYLSPEQLNDSHRIDARSEVYSLGCVLNEILTGRVPFVTTDAALPRAILEDRPVAPRELVPYRGIPRKLSKVVLKALEKKPGKRYDSVLAFAAAVNRCKWNDKGPRKTLPPDIWLKKHPRIFASAIGAAALIAFGTSQYLYNHYNPPYIPYDTPIVSVATKATATTPLTEPLAAAKPTDSGLKAVVPESITVPESLKVKQDTSSATKPPHPAGHHGKKQKPAKKQQQASAPAPKKDTTADTSKPRRVFTPYLRYRIPTPDSSGNK